MTRQIIFAGRFQPFHSGHMSVSQKAMALLEPEDVFVLAAVGQMGIDVPPVHAIFAEVAKEHHRPERNPWPLLVTLRALMEVSKVLGQFEPKSNITVTAIPRPDYGWKQVQVWFPGPRVWLIPAGHEAFDEEKAAFFETMGDQVLRCSDEQGVSGRELRDMWNRGMISEMKRFMPHCVHSVYFPTFPRADSRG